MSFLGQNEPKSSNLRLRPSAARGKVTERGFCARRRAEGFVRPGLEDGARRRRGDYFARTDRAREL